MTRSRGGKEDTKDADVGHRHPRACSGAHAERGLLEKIIDLLLQHEDVGPVTRRPDRSPGSSSTAVRCDRTTLMATAETRGGARMLLDPFLYDFVAEHQRALREAAERAGHGRARVLWWRPVIPCVRRLTSWSIPSGIRPPSGRPRSLGRAR
jgi:hypothetical protein